MLLHHSNYVQIGIVKNVNHLHTCIAVKNGKVIASGRNSSLNQVHAEISVIQKLMKLCGIIKIRKINLLYSIKNYSKLLSLCNSITLYIVRVKKDGSFGNSSPCKHCLNMLQLLKVKKIIFSNEEGLLETHKTINYSTTFLTSMDRNFPR